MFSTNASMQSSNVSASTSIQSSDQSSYIRRVENVSPVSSIESNTTSKENIIICSSNFRIINIDNIYIDNNIIVAIFNKKNNNYECLDSNGFFEYLKTNNIKGLLMKSNYLDEDSIFELLDNNTKNILIKCNKELTKLTNIKEEEKKDKEKNDKEKKDKDSNEGKEDIENILIYKSSLLDKCLSYKKVRNIIISNKNVGKVFPTDITKIYDINEYLNRTSLIELLKYNSLKFTKHENIVQLLMYNYFKIDKIFLLKLIEDRIGKDNFNNVIYDLYIIDFITLLTESDEMYIINKLMKIWYPKLTRNIMDLMINTCIKRKNNVCMKLIIFLHIISKFDNKFSDIFNQDHLKLAMRYNNLIFIKYVHNEHIYDNGIWTAELNDECINENCDNTEEIIDFIKFLHENRLEGFTTSAMDNAARFCNVKVLKYLNEIKKDCTTYAMYNAVKKYDINIIMYLLDLNKKFTQSTIDLLEYKNSIKTLPLYDKIKNILINSNLLVSEPTLPRQLPNRELIQTYNNYVTNIENIINTQHNDEELYNKILDILNTENIDYILNVIRNILTDNRIKELLLKYINNTFYDTYLLTTEKNIDMFIYFFTILYTGKKLDMEILMNKILEMNDMPSLNILIIFKKFINNNFNLNISYKNFIKCFQDNNFDVIVRIFEEDLVNKNFWTTETMDQAATYGNLDIIKYLYNNNLDNCTTDAIDEASLNDHLEVVKFLCQIQKNFTINAINNENENYQILKILYKHKDLFKPNKILDENAFNLFIENNNIEGVKFIISFIKTKSIIEQAVINSFETKHFEIFKIICLEKQYQIRSLIKDIYKRLGKNTDLYKWLKDNIFRRNSDEIQEFLNHMSS